MHVWSRSHHLMLLAAAALAAAAAPVLAADKPLAPKATLADVIKGSAPSDWRPLEIIPIPGQTRITKLANSGTDPNYETG